MDETTAHRRPAGRRRTVQLTRLTAAAAVLLCIITSAAEAVRHNSGPCVSVDVTRTVGMENSQPLIDLYADCSPATKVKVRLAAADGRRTRWLTLKQPSEMVTVWHLLRINRHDVRTLTEHRTFTVHVTARRPDGRWVRQRAVCRPDSCQVR